VIVASGLRAGPFPGGWVTCRSRSWWTASLETRCLGHRLTVLVALGCTMHALPYGNIYLSIYLEAAGGEGAGGTAQSACGWTTGTAI
jgi:hypothetical protein